MAITSGNNQHSTAPYYLGYIEGWEAPRFGSSKAAMFAAAEDASPFGFGDDIADQQFFEGFIAAVQEKQAGRALPSNGQNAPPASVGGRLTVGRVYPTARSGMG